MRPCLTYLALAAAFLGLFGGCARKTVYTELKNNAPYVLIRTLGIDLTDENSLRVTVCSGTPPSGGKPRIFSAEGASLSSALSELLKSSFGMRPMYTHIESVVIGERAAEGGISQYLDYVERSSDVRLDADLYISRAFTAEELIQSAAGEGSSASDMLAELDASFGRLPSGKRSECGAAAVSMSRIKSAAVRAVSPKPGEEEDEPSSVVPAGFAVMYDGKLCGFIDEDAANGAVYLMGGVNFETVAVTDGEGKKASLSVSGANVHILPIIYDGKIAGINITARITAGVEELESGIELSDIAVRRELSKKLSEMLLQRMCDAAAASQRFNADAFGVLEACRLHAPEAAYASDFKSLPISITVTAEVERTFDVVDPAPYGSGRNSG